MKTTLPTDCGNAPRITVVSDWVTHWAKGDTDAVAAWLTDDADWTLLGDVRPEGSTTALEITSVITHGRLASCDGVMDTDSGRVAFSHVFRFASTSKTAKIRQVRTYLVEQAARNGLGEGGVPAGR